MTTRRPARAANKADNVALLAAESCAEQNLTEAAWLAEVARETREIGAEIEGHIAEQRARLGEG